MDAFLLSVAVFCVALEVAMWIDAAARRGERIYRARHRDHSKVPAMRWTEGL
jgi:hypothetical protein